jgi:peptide-methionine (S)-S-oxide reductase
MELTKATLAGGCFWCLEAVYQRIEGIHRIVSGYTGGHTNNPDYRSICSGMTGHAEVVQLDFDSEMVSYSEVLDWFWRMHDPTTLNRQGQRRWHPIPLSNFLSFRRATGTGHKIKTGSSLKFS